MFGLGWTEVLVVAAITVLVVPPKDLPGLMRNVGQTVGKMRRMAGQFQRELEDAVRDEELDKLREQVTEIGRDTDRQLRAATRPKELNDLRQQMNDIGKEADRRLEDATTRYQRPRQRNVSVQTAEPEGGPAMTPLPDGEASRPGTPMPGSAREDVAARPADKGTEPDVEELADEPATTSPAAAKS